MAKGRTTQRRLLAALAILPLVVATTVLILYAMFGSAALRKGLEVEIGALTGRAVSIDGEVNLALSLNPILTVGNVIVGNADWGSRPTMLRLGRVQGQLALLPLLRGDIRFGRMAFTDTELFLETDSLGRGNWLLRDSGNVDSVASTPGVVIDRVTFENLRLIWRDGDSGQVKSLAADRLDLTGIGATDSIQIEAASYDDAVSPKPIWSLRLGLAANATGHAIRDLALVVGQSDVSGDMEIALSDGQQQLTGRLTSKRFRLEDFARIFAGFDRAGFATDADTHRSRSVFSTAPLRIKIPPSLQAAFSFQAQRFDTPRLALDRLSALVTADDGVLSLDDLEADLDGAHLSADLVLDTARERPFVDLRLRGAAVRLSDMWRSGNGRRWLDAEGDFNIAIRGSGRSAAEIMANLSGTARLLTGKGHLDVRHVDAMVGGLSVALQSLTDKNTERTRLNCIASSFKIDKGVATSQLMLADTEHATVFGEGHIDLRSERLDLVLKPKPKTASLNLAVPIEIGGTLADPTFTPEKLTSARKGIGLLAAVGLVSFPPAILLGLGELGSGDDNPCLEAASAASHARARNNNPRNKINKGLIERVTDDANTALDTIGGAIKGLFN